MANISCKKEINDVNYDKLNELYLYNKKNEIIKKTKQKVENEEGSTFKPDIYINNLSKNITSDFYERNKKFIKDNEDYLVSPNKLNFHLDVITLKDNKFYGSLKGHQKKVTSVRYFLNYLNNNEYLISSDEMGIVFVWDITDSYKKLYTINTKYNDIIYSCLLVFTGEGYENVNSNNANHNGYIITSTFDISKENQNSATKIYSIDNGEFVNYIKNTNTNSVFYLLSWLNKKDNRNYIIQFCYMKILINNLLDEDDVYAELSQEQKLSHYSGFIYEKKDESDDESSSEEDKKKKKKKNKKKKEKEKKELSESSSSEEESEDDKKKKKGKGNKKVKEVKKEESEESSEEEEEEKEVKKNKKNKKDKKNNEKKEKEKEKENDDDDDDFEEVPDNNKKRRRKEK